MSLKPGDTVTVTGVVVRLDSGEAVCLNDWPIDVKLVARAPKVGALVCVAGLDGVFTLKALYDTRFSVQEIGDAILMPKLRMPTKEQIKASAERSLANFDDDVLDAELQRRHKRSKLDN